MPMASVNVLFGGMVLVLLLTRIASMLNIVLFVQYPDRFGYTARLNPCPRNR